MPIADASPLIYLAKTERLYLLKEFYGLVQIKIFLSDDDDAKEFAKNYGIDGRGTIYLLLKSYEKGFFNKNECAKTFENMIDKGFWVNPGVIKVFYKTLEKIGKF